MLCQPNTNRGRSIKQDAVNERSITSNSNKGQTLARSRSTECFAAATQMHSVRAPAIKVSLCCPTILKDEPTDDSRFGRN